MNHTEVTVSAENLAKIIKLTEKQSLSTEQGEALSCLLDDLRLKVQTENNLTNREYYNWLDRQ